MTTRLRSAVVLCCFTLTAAVVVNSLAAIKILDRVDALEARADTLARQVVDLSAGKADAGTMNLLADREELRGLDKRLGGWAVIVAGLEEKLAAMERTAKANEAISVTAYKMLRDDVDELQRQVAELTVELEYVRGECEMLSP
jgi:polyhydroxyalkanoate synthesis regulator phasin